MRISSFFPVNLKYPKDLQHISYFKYNATYYYFAYNFLFLPFFFIFSKTFRGNNNLLHVSPPPDQNLGFAYARDKVRKKIK